MRRRTFALCVARALVLQSCFSGWASGQMNANGFFKSDTERAVAEAAADGRTDRLQALVAAGADVNARGVDGMTALHWALLRSSRKGFAWLLEHGADPNVIFTQNGTSATSLAAKQEDDWFLKEVLAHGGNVNIRNPLNGRTPLVEAMASGRNGNVRILISAGADMNTFDHLGMTPLAAAAATQKYELAYEMLQAGADPTTKMPRLRGETLLSIIRRSRVLPGTPAYEWQLKVVELLRQKGLDVEHGD